MKKNFDTHEKNALKDRESQFRKIAENSGDMIFRMSLPDGKYEYVSPAAADITGYSPEEFYNNPLLIEKVIHPDWVAYFKDELEKLNKGEVAPCYEYKIIHKSGEQKWVYQANMLFFDEKGRPAAIEGIVTDINDRKKAEEALKQSELRFKMQYHGSPIPTFTWQKTDDDFALIEINKAALVMTEGRASYFIGQKASDMYRHHQDVLKDMRICLETKDVVKKELVSRHFMPGRIIIVTYAYVPNDLVMVHVEDVSEQRQASTEKKKLEIQLAQAHKMEAIGTLAGGIAHDFNNILTAIIGYTELAIFDIQNTKELHPRLQEVLKASNRAKTLINQILTFSRKAEITYSPLSLATLLKETLKMMRSLIPSTIEIKQEISDSGLVLSDPTHINQIMMNLCTNAAQAMESQAGGILGISLNRVVLDNEISSEIKLKPGSYMKLSISDTGHGITPENMERIYDPYFTTKEVGRGTGLGLSVVHGIVNSHQGAIVCKSTPGMGTVFDVYLPEIEASREPAHEIPAGHYPKGTERILFIDDEPALAQMAADILIKLGYNVMTMTNSRAALELLNKDPGAFDLVITDMTMPKLRGDVLISEILKVRTDIPVILCTGYSENMTADRARKIGAVEFIIKPYELEKLANTIRNVLDK